MFMHTGELWAQEVRSHVALMCRVVIALREVSNNNNNNNSNTNTNNNMII